LSASTVSPQQFQEFQPSGGVSAIRSPTSTRKFFSAEPKVFFACNLTVNSPIFERASDTPGVHVKCKPFGSPLAENFMGRLPVAGMLNKKGEPGRTPKTFGR